MIVEWILRHGPTIERFIHHQKAHPITEVEKLRRRRIVCGANRVHAETLEDFQTALPGPQGHGNTKGAGIAMQADALDLEVATVEPEAGIGSKARFTNSKVNCLIIKGAAFFVDYFHYGAIEDGVIKIPKRGIVE